MTNVFAANATIARMRPNAARASTASVTIAVLLFGAAVLAIVVPAAFGSTPQARSAWRVRTSTPAAVRGGVIAVEVEPAEPGRPESAAEHWPATLPVVRADGVKGDALLGVVMPAPPRPAPSWTQPADDLLVVAPSRLSELRAAGAAPAEVVLVALLRFDDGFVGDFEIAGAAVKPRWLEPDPELSIPNEIAGGSSPTSDDAAARGTHDGPLAPRAGDAGLPDARSPGEYWRAVLLAEQLGRPCEAPPFDRLAALYARHRAELWCAGLARIRAASASVAAALREQLTARVRDPLRPAGDDLIAAWVAGPGDLHALLGILLDTERSAESSMQAALGWMEARSALTIWVESDAGPDVELAVANPLHEEVVVRCAWLEAPHEVAVAHVVPAHEVARFRIERPVESSAGRPGRARAEFVERWRGGLTLRLESGTWRGRMMVGPGAFSVRPPGLGFAMFAPTLTLVAAQSQRMAPVASAWRTTASLRRLGPRWELFIECLRPAPESGDLVEIAVGAPAGVEAPTDRNAAHAPAPALTHFTVDEHGAITMRGGAVPTGLAAHARRFSDRWRVRIELPDRWIPALQLGNPERALLVAIERRPGAHHGRQTAGIAVPAWRPAAPIRADLASWTDIPAPSR